jgi:hypothetical protein
MSDDKVDIKLSDLNFGGLFKLFFATGVLIWILFAGFWALLAFSAPEAVKINNVPAENTLDAMKGVPLVLLLGTMFSVFGAALGAGLLRIFGKILPLGKLN